METSRKNIAIFLHFIITPRKMRCNTNSLNIVKLSYWLRRFTFYLTVAASSKYLTTGESRNSITRRRSVAISACTVIPACN